ncbi:MAG: AraC-like DNA-binding protein [Moritella sp.]|jgi:AraC-like DNA-binding protein
MPLHARPQSLHWADEFGIARKHYYQRINEAFGYSYVWVCKENRLHDQACLAANRGVNMDKQKNDSGINLIFIINFILEFNHFNKI